MASFLTSASRIALRSLRPTSLRIPARHLHPSPVALKRKSRKGEPSQDDDLFGSEDSLFAPADDLFDTAAPAESVAATPATASASAATASSTLKLSPEQRLTRFNELFSFVSDRIGAKPLQKLPPVRTSAWQHLFGLATTPAQLDQVAALFPRWRDAHRIFDARTSEAFVRRCEELHHPELALAVFSDHPKYALDLTLPAARRLLHALHQTHPLPDVLTLAALYRVYALPPLASDLTSCALLAAACFRDRSPAAAAVARSLVPQLRTALVAVPPQTMALRRSPVLRARDAEREKAWLAWTLAKIERALARQGEDVAWLRDWRTASGHVKVEQVKKRQARLVVPPVAAPAAEPQLSV